MFLRFFCFWIQVRNMILFHSMTIQFYFVLPQEPLAQWRHFSDSTPYTITSSLIPRTSTFRWLHILWLWENFHLDSSKTSTIDDLTLMLFHECSAVAVTSFACHVHHLHNDAISFHNSEADVQDMKLFIKPKNRAFQTPIIICPDTNMVISKFSLNLVTFLYLYKQICALLVS